MSVVPLTVQAAEVVVAMSSEPTTLDPHTQDDGSERFVNDNVYETLYVRDAVGTLSPGLAESLPTQVDALTWEIVVKEGISFHNGEPLDAEAVAFSIRRIVDPALASGQISYVSTIADAVAVDARTVRVTTSEPDPVLTARLYWIKIVPPLYAEDPAFAEHPIGTGPYEFVSWARGEEIVLKAAEDYWDGDVVADEAVFRFIPEASTQLAGLMSGEIDLITNVAPEFVEQLPKSAVVDGLELPFIVINALPGSPTSDVRVRQAMLHAINREELALGLFDGTAVVATGQLAVPAAFGFDPTVEPYAYDPDRARALLEEAGAMGATVEIVAPTGRFTRDREMAETLGAYWTAVGLNAVVTLPEWSEFLARIFDRESRPDVYYASSANELFDVDRAITAYYHPEGNGASNADTQIGEWIDEARSETDVAARQALYGQIFQRASDEAYVASLLQTKDVYGLSERIDWTPRIDGKVLLRDVTAVTE